MRRFTIWLFPILLLGLLPLSAALAAPGTDGDPDIPQIGTLVKLGGRAATTGENSGSLTAQVEDRVGSTKARGPVEREDGVMSRGFESVESLVARLAAFWQLRLFR